MTSRLHALGSLGTYKVAAVISRDRVSTDRLLMCAGKISRSLLSKFFLLFLSVALTTSIVFWFRVSYERVVYALRIVSR